MFVRTKKSGKYTYLQVVYSQRDGDRVRQRVVGTLGRLDLLQETGELDALMISMQQFSEHLAVIGESAKATPDTSPMRPIGAALIFGRLWKELGIDRVIENRSRDRRFGFSMERALLVAVLQRLVHPGSDRQAERWNQAAQISGSEPLALQHFYRAMGWLGTPLPEDQQAGATPFAPRCVKDLMEEDLFARRRDLFTDLDLVFFDTTSIYFEGRGGESLGKLGHTKDHRPDLRQMVVGMVLDGQGNPICAELWPGNTTDVKTLVPIAGRLRNRFHVERVCLVADRGMISKGTIQELEALKWSYILGARMRSNKEVRDEVLARAGAYQEVTPERMEKKDPAPLKVKEVSVSGRRYIVCLNEEEARKDRHDREAIVVSLREALKHGDKALVGNKGFRKYLSTTQDHFMIDEEKVEQESRYDGKWVLTTNTDMASADVALKYKQLWMVEDIFRSTKSLLETRPIFHKCNETICGHVWVSFLALILRKELQARLESKRKEGEERLEWADVVSDLATLGQTEIQAGGKRYLLRCAAGPAAVRTFAACGVALPPVLKKI